MSCCRCFCAASAAKSLFDLTLPSKTITVCANLAETHVVFSATLLRTIARLNGGLFIPGGIWVEFNSPPEWGVSDATTSELTAYLGFVLFNCIVLGTSEARSSSHHQWYSPTNHPNSRPASQVSMATSYKAIGPRPAENLTTEHSPPQV